MSHLKLFLVSGILEYKNDRTCIIAAQDRQEAMVCFAKTFDYAPKFVICLSDEKKATTEAHLIHVVK